MEKENNNLEQTSQVEETTDVKTESVSTQQEDKIITQDEINAIVEKRLARQSANHKKELEEVKSTTDAELLMKVQQLEEKLEQNSKQSVVTEFVSKLRTAGVDDSAIAVLTETVDVDKMSSFDPSAFVKKTDINTVSVKTHTESSKLGESETEFNPYDIY